MIINYQEIKAKRLTASNSAWQSFSENLWRHKIFFSLPVIKSERKKCHETLDNDHLIVSEMSRNFIVEMETPDEILCVLNTSQKFVF